MLQVLLEMRDFGKICIHLGIPLYSPIRKMGFNFQNRAILYNVHYIYNNNNIIIIALFKTFEYPNVFLL